MKNKSRILAILVALCLVLAVVFVAACNNNDGDDIILPTDILVSIDAPDSTPDTTFTTRFGVNLRLTTEVLPSTASQTVVWETLDPTIISVVDGLITPQRTTGFDLDGNPVPARIRVSTVGRYGINEVINIIVDSAHVPPQNIAILTIGERNYIDLSTGVFTLNLRATSDTVAARLDNLRWESAYPELLAVSGIGEFATLTALGDSGGQDVRIDVIVPGGPVRNYIYVNIRGVRPTPVSEVTILNGATATIDLTIGNELELEALIEPISANVRSVFWSTLDATIATIETDNEVVGDRATATVRANNRTTRATVQIAIEVFYGGTTHDMGSVRRTITITVEPEEIINGGGNGNGNGDPVLPNLTGTWTGTTLFISGVGTINPLATFEQTIGHLENVFDDFYGINPNNLFVLMVIELAEMIIDDEDADNMEDAMELAFEELAFLLHYAEMEFVDNFARWYIGDFLVNEDLMIFVPTATAGLYRVYAGFETEYDWIGTFNSNTNEIRIQMMVEGAWLVLSQ